MCFAVVCVGVHRAYHTQGEKGVAKSTTCAFLKSLIDPSATGNLFLSSDQRTLLVNLQQHWFLPFDNVSKVNDHTSDELCRAITGSGNQQRKLHTNDGDVIFKFRRCLAINGISNTVTRPDLLDRSILIEMERLSPDARRAESEIGASFERDRAEIMGGIFDTLSKAMAIFPTVELDQLPRMADFAQWGYAIGEALGGLGREFLDQYMDNIQKQNTEAVHSDPVATLIVALMDGRKEWSGLVSELLIELRTMAALYGISVGSADFPKQPNGLSRRMSSLTSNLETFGIHYKNAGHQRHGTVVSLKRDLSSPSSHRHGPAGFIKKAS